MPDTFLEILKSWEYVELMRRVRGWYAKNAKSIISSEEALRELTAKIGLSEETLIEKLASEAEMKREDAFLVLIGMGGGAEYIVTWNKAHLRDKREKIEEIGTKLGLRVPKIVFPTEI